MAPFNKRQVGFIKAVAGVGKHKTYIHSRIDTDLATSAYVLSTTNSRVDVSKKAGVVYTVALNHSHTAIDAAETSTDPTQWSPESTTISAGCKKSAYMDQMSLLDAPVIAPGDETNNPSTGSRVGPEFYLDSTHLRMRFTMPDFTIASSGSTKQPHYEYRLIMFRPRKPVASATHTDFVRDGPTALLGGASFINFHYDLFNGYVARPVGLQGYRAKQELDGDEYYSGNKRSTSTFVAQTTPARFNKGPTGEGENLTMDDFMTLPVNDADYIIKCDERFFLGPEHGKSHFEKNVRVAWSERGETDQTDMAQGLKEGFNANWYIMLLATSNDSVAPNLNVLYRGTTYVESS